MLKISHCTYTNIPKFKKLKSCNISGPSISDKGYATITICVIIHSFFVIHYSKSEILVQNTNKYYIRKQAGH